MFKFDNTHIFTGYLKQLLSSINIPTCKIYTKDFAEYFAKNGKEDPRVIESFDKIAESRPAVRVNYLKDNKIYNYFWKYSNESPDLGHGNTFWTRSSMTFYDSSEFIPGLTKTLYSPGGHYDVTTHEYLGEYLRFLRDYYDVNLMSLYNCFNNKIYNNIYCKFPINKKEVIFDSQNSKYHIYAFPVKLFSDYTIAIDCSQEVEMFCGLYGTTLDNSNKSVDLITKTYKKINKTIFNQPFLYDKLNVKYWNHEVETAQIEATQAQTNPAFPLINSDNIARCDIINREQDLKLFIKVPSSCKSSIVVLEGDFRSFNDFKYAPQPREEYSAQSVWKYNQNHEVINFGDKKDRRKIDPNARAFRPIGKIQLLAFNTGESFPFADRLIEYLSGSAITSIDAISDNIKRAQKVMKQNGYHFKIEGIWENKMQKIIYDYIINAGPIESTKEGNLIDKRRGYHPRLGYTTKSTLYDVLGYIDRDAEKWYASWEIKDNKAKMRDSIQSVDIYNGLYDV